MWHAYSYASLSLSLIGLMNLCQEKSCKNKAKSKTERRSSEINEYYTLKRRFLCAYDRTLSCEQRRDVSTGAINVFVSCPEGKTNVYDRLFFPVSTRYLSITERERERETTSDFSALTYSLSLVVSIVSVAYIGVSVDSRRTSHWNNLSFTVANVNCSC
jgi:hypothetical protein